MGIYENEFLIFLASGRRPEESPRPDRGVYNNPHGVTPGGGGGVGCCGGSPKTAGTNQAECEALCLDFTSTPEGARWIDNYYKSDWHKKFEELMKQVLGNKGNFIGVNNCAFESANPWRTKNSFNPEAPVATTANPWDPDWPGKVVCNSYYSKANFDDDCCRNLQAIAAGAVNSVCHMAISNDPSSLMCPDAAALCHTLCEQIIAGGVTAGDIAAAMATAKSPNPTSY